MILLSSLLSFLDKGFWLMRLFLFAKLLFYLIIHVLEAVLNKKILIRILTM